MGLPREFPEVFDAIEEIVNTQEQDASDALAALRRKALLVQAKKG